MIRIRVRVTGTVQGVGFRPFVWRRATAVGLTGWVSNDSSGVTIEVQGSAAQVKQFWDSFERSAPPLARIDALSRSEIAVVPETDFCVVESSSQPEHSTPVSPDISICSDCLREMSDHSNRRYAYPFINCTNCGPRYTIVTDIPYDRESTTMNSFVMCRACQSEYDDPGNRRFHAQPNACPRCGPAIWFSDDLSRPDLFECRPTPCPSVEATIQAFRKAIGDGLIVAVKGIGGFHLACDATSVDAVKRLRERKGRTDKPFAIMVCDAELAKQFAHVGAQEQAILESRERPIVLLSKRNHPPQEFASGEVAAPHDPVASPHNISPGHLVAPCHLVAPGNDFIGVMLPYSPLHQLLSEKTPLVMTSGNLSDEPIVRTNAEAGQRISTLADCFLLHDRDINVVCDDSVVRCVDDQFLPIRRSRGYAPMPIALHNSGPSVLAVGGEIKSTFCVTKANYAYMSQHIGDMGNMETLDAMKRSVKHLLRLFRIEPAAICSDLHPDYLSSRWAEGLADSLGVPLIRVQHHFAHVASLIAEHAWPTGDRIIGCCLDGTGYGLDEAIWGGEFIVADGIRFERIAKLGYMSLPGGDASIKRPHRTALAYLWSNGLPWDESIPSVAATNSAERKLLRSQLEHGVNCIASSSMGRLFDAVASIVGIRHLVNYEAQAAMEMEALAADVIDDVDPQAYSFGIDHHAAAESTIEMSSLLRQICNDVRLAKPPSVIAAQFHHAVARMIDDTCQFIRSETGIQTVGLTGGVFQNVLLSKLARKCLRESGFQVLTHRVVPPNDGGIALGQAVMGRNRMQHTSGAG